MSTASELVKVACVQMSVVSDDREANIRKAAGLLEEAAAQGAQVAVLAELSFDHFFPQHPTEPGFFDLGEPIPGPTTERLQALADELGLIIVPNLLEKGPVGTHFDSSPVIAADGTLVGWTRMMHIAECAGFHEKYYYAPSTTGPTCYAFELCTLGVAICYDRHFPEYMRMLALQGAEIICVPTANLAEEPLDMFIDEMRATAFQNQVFIAMTNRVGEDGGHVFGGRSVIIGPDGAVLEEASAADDQVVIATCDLGQIDAQRRDRPWFRDRRPEWYVMLSEPTVEPGHEPLPHDHEHDHGDHEHDHGEH